METIVIHRPPLNSSDLEEIIALLRSADVFTPSFITDGMDIYHPFTYVREHAISKTETHLLADRNVVTRWLALLDGAVAEPEHRVAAAVMAFAQCAGIIIEPSLALYEVAATAGNNAANEELCRFRIADNLDPTYWAAVALGRSVKLSPPAQLPAPPARAPVDFMMPLRRWRRNYIIALKLAELELRGGRAEARMAELLRWMYEDFLIGGPGLILSIHYLAPNSDRKRLLKNLRSADRERAIRGVRNAAWDITLLSEWLNKIQEQAQQNRLVLLCSLDHKVVTFARLLANESVEEPTSVALSRIFESLWGPAVGRRLSARLESYSSSADNPARQLHRPEELESIDRLIQDGEAVIRDWKPRSA